MLFGDTPLPRAATWPLGPILFRHDPCRKGVHEAVRADARTSSRIPPFAPCCSAHSMSPMRAAIAQPQPPCPSCLAQGPCVPRRLRASDRSRASRLRELQPRSVDRPRPHLYSNN